MKPETHDDYLEQFSGAIRRTLDELRALIGRLVPEAEETIAYGIAAYRLKGKYFLGYGGAKKHCALYLKPATLEKFPEALASYDTSKGTLRLTPGSPLPEALLTRLIRDRESAHLAKLK